MNFIQWLLYIVVISNVKSNIELKVNTNYLQKFDLIEADVTDKFEKLREKFSGFENNIMTVERGISDLEQ